MSKKFKTYDEQIQILQERNLLIRDKNAVRRILQRGNYYNIINGYKDLFLDKSLAVETFYVGATFDEIVALFKFDKKLKKIFLDRLLKMENAIKSVIAY